MYISKTISKQLHSVLYTSFICINCLTSLCVLAGLSYHLFFQLLLRLQYSISSDQPQPLNLPWVHAVRKQEVQWKWGVFSVPAARHFYIILGINPLRVKLERGRMWRGMWRDVDREGCGEGEGEGRGERGMGGGISMCVKYLFTWSFLMLQSYKGKTPYMFNTKWWTSNI